MRRFIMTCFLVAQCVSAMAPAWAAAQPVSDHCEAMQMQAGDHPPAPQASAGTGLHADCLDECPECLVLGALPTAAAATALAGSAPVYRPRAEAWLVNRRGERLLRPPISA
ncbi:MAG: hypothetical protein V2J12_02830 [Gammaproteobacteria bacterium]|jgi:hypothetical protein|nr:hypothetical protein [Gammaproteobacteria bacterium]